MNSEVKNWIGILMAEPNCFDDDDEVTHLKSKLSSSCRSFSPFFCRIWGMQEFFFSSKYPWLPWCLSLSQNHKRRREETLSRRRLPLSMNQFIFPVFVNKNPYNPSCPRIKRMICFFICESKGFLMYPRVERWIYY